MSALLVLALSISSVAYRDVPAGTQLHIRLTSTVGTYASLAGSPVSAVLIAPVIVDGVTVLAAGSTLSGRVRTVTRVGLGIRHETAGLDLEFDRLNPLDGPDVSLAGRVAEVDNSRERVTANGHIHGVRSTGSLCYRVSGYLRILLRWEPHFELAEWAVKSLIGELPEPEIYYPAGVELTLSLTDDLPVTWALPEEQNTQPLNDGERADLDTLIGGLPERTYDPASARLSDPTNLLFVGSREELVTAFSAAGWTRANPTSLRRRIRWIRAVAELRGDRAGPMSSLLLAGAKPDMSWEKGLNDVSKRHHVRIWRSGEWHGQELWIGAATRDVDFAYLRPGQALSHKIDENIDQERDKVAYDLAFTSCSHVLDWRGRAGVPHASRNGTGDPMTTDTGMAIVGLEDCSEPRLSTETFDEETIPVHGSLLQRFLRREILSARNDLIRTNPYWRTFEGGRMLFAWYRQHRRRDSPGDLILSKSSGGRLPTSARLMMPR